MGMRIKSKRHKDARAGFVVGELLLGLLLLAVAVSSLAALMYSVSRRTDAPREQTECVSSGPGARGKCMQPGPKAASTLLRSGCAEKKGASVRGCSDSLVGVDSSDEMIIRSRTDSASLALLAKKQEAERARRRTDRGFIR
jgi:hypothetical protein